jgi:phage gp46-like protein
MIAIAFDTASLSGDLDLGPSGLAQDDTLTTSVLISLFSDRRARADDPLPNNSDGDRRGWLGDALADTEGDRIGSRLWLLKREKQTEETRRRAEEYCREALAWLIDDGLAVRVDVTAEWVAMGILGVEIVIFQADGTAVTQKVNVATGGV